MKISLLHRKKCASCTCIGVLNQCPVLAQCTYYTEICNVLKLHMCCLQMYDILALKLCY